MVQIFNLNLLQDLKGSQQQKMPMAQQGLPANVLNAQRVFWVFTLNYPNNELHQDAYENIEPKLRDFVTQGKINYIIWGREICPTTGRRHLQGYLELPKIQRGSQVKRLFQPLSPEIDFRKGTQEQAIEYCQKDNDWEEHGTKAATKKQGKRNDLERFKRAVQNGETFDETIESHSMIHAKHAKFARIYCDRYKPGIEVQNHPLRPWQVQLEQALVLPADDRTITFVVDSIGNSGKTWFCYRWIQGHPETQLMKPGKYADMALQLREDIKYFFMDVPRQKAETIQYSFLESIKDRMVASNKYESTTKFMVNKVHVVVFTNHEPDATALSGDRYNIIRI